jgi:hypothetical protein
MEMAVDTPGRDEAACDVVQRGRVVARIVRADARDRRPDQADLGLAQLAGQHIDERAAGERQVEGPGTRGAAPRAGRRCDGFGYRARLAVVASVISSARAS